MIINTRSFKPVKGVIVGHPAAVRLQRMIAFGVVVLPVFGVVVATIRGIQSGVAWWEWTVFGVMYVLCVAGVSIGFHRHFAHRAFKAHPWVRRGLGIFGSMASQGPLVYWVAQHRRHHVYSDVPGDPHSPHLHGGGWRGMLHGLWHAHIGWMFSAETAQWTHFADDNMRDPESWWVHRTYFRWVLLGLALPAVAGVALSGSLSGAWGGFLWGGMVRMFAVNQASWCVGSICHAFGRQPFRTEDHSTNNFWVALFTFGEGLQNNHHAFPSSAAHALKWGEPDFSLIIIRSMERLGMIWDVKHPSRQAIAKALKPST